MTTLVRVADPSDAEGIAAVHVAAWQSGYAGLLPQRLLDSLSVEERTGVWNEILGRAPAPGLATLVAELDGEVIGFARVGPSRDEDAAPGTGELRGLYLHPDHWGAGHGHALHARALATLAATAEPAVTDVTLWVLAGNERARRFYERHGWRLDGEAKTEWLGEARLDEVRYRCTLPAGRST